jgi:uncharacterized protein involved in exopolysaccharide biosynthesis
VAKAINLVRRQLLVVGVDREAGLVTVRVSTRWPSVSEQLAQALRDAVEHFNLHARRSQASAEQAFLAERLDTARGELVRSELALQEFLLRNRSWSNDPRLAFEHDRLEREIGLRQNVYTVVSQSFEQARAAAVRNTPSVSLVETGRMPLVGDRRYTLLKAATTTIVSFGVLLTFLWWRHAFVQGRSHQTEGYLTLVALLNRLIPGKVLSRR